MTACKWHGPYTGEVTGCCIHQRVRDGADPFTELYATLPECQYRFRRCRRKATRKVRFEVSWVNLCDDHHGARPGGFEIVKTLPWADIVREQERRK